MRIEIRGNQVVLDGYVNAVGRESRALPAPGIPGGRFIEQIVPKTFERALQKAENVDLLFNHDKTMKLGSTQERNLQLYEDNIGLRAIATVTDESVIERAKSGKLQGWSFGFIDNNPQFKDGEDGIQRRFVSDIDLLEVSILDKTPAYIATSIEARGEEQLISETRSNEFKAEISDLSPEEPEIREIDYSIYEKQIEILKLKGGK